MTPAQYTLHGVKCTLYCTVHCTLYLKREWPLHTAHTPAGRASPAWIQSTFFYRKCITSEPKPKPKAHNKTSICKGYEGELGQMKITLQARQDDVTSMFSLTLPPTVSWASSAPSRQSGQPSFTQSCGIHRPSHLDSQTVRQSECQLDRQTGSQF